MARRSQILQLVRGGNDPTHCQDAAAADDRAGRYAVADGASEGCFTGLWARLLVRDFVDASTLAVDRWAESLAAVQGRWDADVHGRALRRSAQRGVERGAFATFLGVALGEKSDFSAVAAGDACLMHTRGNALLRAFPLTRSTQFDNEPDLVGSRMSPEAVGRRQRLWTDGAGAPGDRLWAMTDALAQWCLAECESGGNPWDEIERLLESDDAERDFAAWIERNRDARRLKNDDATLLVIEL